MKEAIITAARRAEEVEAEINALKNELDSVKGSATEVYARIVGYYRSIRNWNAGKKSEFSDRLAFKFERAAERLAASESLAEGRLDASSPSAIAATSTARVDPALSIPVPSLDEAKRSFWLFARANCPNCPPVKRFLDEHGFEGRIIDVDSDEGYQLASSHSVFAAPTVVFIDSMGREYYRAHNVKELSLLLEMGA
jgi:ribonucleoside-triphosphate reductase